MITLDNISFAYNRTPVIDKLSCRVPAGRWLGIIGPNGSGKTTILKLISGLLTPETGEINLDNQPVKSYSRREMARLLAVVPQVSPFAFSFTALEVVLMGRHPYIKSFGFETRSDIEVTKDSMKKTDTWRFRNRPIDELSGGERQRVLIARALAEEPKILLLDEPTTFLDIKHQLDIMDILTELNKNEDLTIVSAIHDINLAISYCHDIALLHRGKIEKTGSSEEVITYKNLKDIFGAEVYVGLNEFTGRPYYVPARMSF